MSNRSRNYHHHPAVVLLLVFEILLGVQAACPSFCACKWRNGKQTVTCNNQGLEDVPEGLDTTTQVLEFSKNRLTELPAELFSNRQLVNLQRIFMAECRIRAISAGTFKGLSNLVELDLSGNSIETVPTSAFVDCSSLMRLTLSANPIKVLKKFAFNHLSFLNTLELSGCALQEIEEGAFQGLPSLEWLWLDDNKLKTIKGQGTLPHNLKGVELRGNNWECDCHIKELFVWLQNFHVPASVEPTCAGPPRLGGRPIRSIPAPDLACLPDVSPTTFYLELAEGRNVSLLCHVHAVPEADISWWFRGQTLQNNTNVAPGLRLLYFVEEGAENKRSELFIYNTNSEDNGTFVCSAENPAGIAHANFTIKIVLREDPVVIVVSVPFEVFVAASVAVCVLLLLTVVCVIVGLLKCRMRRKRRRQEKREKAKDCQQDVASKMCETVFEQEVINYPVNRIALASPPVKSTDSPVSLRRYQLEQNPDIINGTEGCRLSPQILLRRTTNPDLGWSFRGWSPVVVDSEGYPVDYGLPKVTNCYRTLPNNRMKRALSIPRTRFSQEVEFCTPHPIPYEPYTANVRYTVGGYPEAAPTSLPCCSGQWPPCVPSNMHAAPAPPINHPKKCVSAQTEQDIKAEDSANEVLTESPDEGYEGEPAVV